MITATCPIEKTHYLPAISKTYRNKKLVSVLYLIKHIKTIYHELFIIHHRRYPHYRMGYRDLRLRRR